MGGEGSSEGAGTGTGVFNVVSGGQVIASNGLIIGLAGAGSMTISGSSTATIEGAIMIGGGFAGGNLSSGLGALMINSGGTLINNFGALQIAGNQANVEVIGSNSAILITNGFIEVGSDLAAGSLSILSGSLLQQISTVEGDPNDGGMQIISTNGQTSQVTVSGTNSRLLLSTTFDPSNDAGLLEMGGGTLFITENTGNNLLTISNAKSLLSLC